MTEMRPEQIEAAKREYERLRPSLIVKYPGQYVVIDPISKEYFIHPISSTALREAINKYPGREFLTMKIGPGTAFSFKG